MFGVFCMVTSPDTWLVEVVTGLMQLGSCGWLGSVVSRKQEDRRKAAEMEVRSLTGYGAEKATHH